MPNRYQLGIWYFSSNNFGILLVLSILSNVLEAVNSVKSWYFPHILKLVRFRYFQMVLVGIWFGIGTPIFCN